jgi:hypothetical protein
MTINYRVFDARAIIPVPPDILVEASTPEAAAKSALGIDLVQHGNPTDLVARVYWKRPGEALRMARLYSGNKDPSNWKKTATPLQQSVSQWTAVPISGRPSPDEKMATMKPPAR